MNFNEIELPHNLIETLDAILQKVKLQNPELTESLFIEQIFWEWLEPFKREPNRISMPRKKVVVKNNLRQAIKLSSKSQSQIAREIGVHRAYINQIITGKYEPSISIAFLLTEALNYPSEKIKDLFYLEPAPGEE